MNAKKGEYVFVQEVKEDGKIKKPELVRVASKPSEDGTFQGKPEKGIHLTNSTSTYTTSDVILELGRNPKPGRVYGYDLSKIFRETKQHDAFGDLHYFTVPSEKANGDFLKGLDRSADLLSKKGLGFLFKKSRVSIEITPKNGKYAGMYIHSKPDSEKPPRVQFSVTDDVLNTASIASYTYVVLHEYAHVLDFQFLNRSKVINTAWINMYCHSIGPRQVPKDQCAKLLEFCLTHEGKALDMYGHWDEETMGQFRLILKWIREIKSITHQDVFSLIESKTDNSRLTLETIWPTVNIDSKKLKPIVTDYACKNRRELFAESVSHYLLDKKLPKNISTMVERSLEKAKVYSKDM
jgi:hypothetical protein